MNKEHDGSMEVGMKKAMVIGIVGLGLIGGSLAKALKADNRHVRIVACDLSRPDLDRALADRVVDAVLERPGPIFLHCSLVFLCIPVSAMRSLVAELLPYLPETCILIDTGSTKSEVMGLFDELSLRHRFIGGHPMAGSERSGYAASRANLFENAYFVLTPYPETQESALEAVIACITGTGAIPLRLAADVHDRSTALISHLPHAMASLLVETVALCEDESGLLRRLAAGGFKDVTRITSSSPDLWAGICLSNREPLRDALLLMMERTGRVLEQLESGDRAGLVDFFEKARQFRDSLSANATTRLQGAAEITVDVEDKPGIIASIATALADAEINIKNIGINHVRVEDEGALLIRFESAEERDAAATVLLRQGYGVKVRE